MNTRRLLTLVAILSALTAAPAAPADDAGAVIESVLSAYGGWTWLSAIKGYRAEGTVLTGHQESEKPTSRLFVRPGRLKVVISHPGRDEVRLLDGGKGWRTGSGRALVEADGVMLDSMVLQAARANLPWILAERRDVAKLGDSLAVPGRSLTSVIVPLGEGLTLTAFVDPATHLIDRVITQLDRPAMTTGFEARFSDFREVEGVRFPFREENFASGTHTASTQIVTLSLNPKNTEADFRP